MRVDRNEQGVELGAHWGEKFFFEFSSKKCRVLCISIAKNYTCGQKPNLGALIDPTGGRRCKMNVSWKFSTTRQLAPWLKMCYITSISLVKLISWWESSSKWMWNVCCNLLNVVYAVTWMRTDGNAVYSCTVTFCVYIIRCKLILPVEYDCIFAYLVLLSEFL